MNVHQATISLALDAGGELIMKCVQKTREGPPRFLSSFKDCTEPQFGDSDGGSDQNTRTGISGPLKIDLPKPYSWGRVPKLLGVTAVQAGQWIADGALNNGS